jgi:indolepyruvate ferredoxin oxidoreductase beta subunit
MTTGSGQALKDATNFILVGVGGQGTLLASNVLAELGMRMGYDVKKAEVHGMSQRGGSVTSHLRWGQQVFSPIVPNGEADFFLAFEKLEALRFAASVRSDGIALVNNYAIVPMTVIAGGPPYPHDDQIKSSLKQMTGNLFWIEGYETVQNLGDPRVANVVMLGALSALMTINTEDWLGVIGSSVPAKSVPINRRAFLAGRQIVLHAEKSISHA